MVAMELDLAQVRAFVAAADRSSMSRAAAALHVSQQALSKRVRRLEDVVGPLFERGAAGVALTEAGARFLPAARQLLATADAALAAARALPAEPLRVDVWGHLHAPMRLVRRFAEEHPEVVIELSMRRSLPQALAAVQRRELDLAFGNVADLAGPLPEGLRAVPVAVTPLLALVNRAGPFATADAVNAEALRVHGLWLPFAASSPELVAFAAGYAARHGVPLRTDGANLGLDVLVEHIGTHAEAVTLYDHGWGPPADARVRLVPLRPPPRFPWYAVRATGPVHPSLDQLIAAVRREGQPAVVPGDQEVLDAEPPAP